MHLVKMSGLGEMHGDPCHVHNTGFFSFSVFHVPVECGCH